MAFRTFFALLFLFLLLPSLIAQNIEWEENFGGSEEEHAHSIVQTADGGFVIAGSSRSSDQDVGGNNGNWDYWVVKLDSSRNIQWEKNLGGSNRDKAYSIVQTSDGGFAVAGKSSSDDGDISDSKGLIDYWVVKLDSSGDLQWENNYGGSQTDRARSIIQTSDGGFAIAGDSYSTDGDLAGNLSYGNGDYWVVKLDSSGNLQWENNFGGSDGEQAQSIVQTSDGGFAMAGYTFSTDGLVGEGKGDWDYWIVRIDPNGDFLWERNLGGSEYEYPIEIIQTFDGGFAINGLSSSSDSNVGGNNGEGDYWVAKIDSLGDLQWEENFGGSSEDLGKFIIQTSDGGFAVGGASSSSDGDVGGNHGYRDYWVLKLDSNRNIQWEENYGGSFGDYPRSMIQTSDGGFAMAGFNYSSGGDVGGNNGKDDYWVLKIDTGATSSLRKKREEGEFDISLHPNPTSGQLQIDLGRAHEEAQVTIRDLRGRVVSSQRVESASNFRTAIEGEAGVYFVEIVTDDGWKEVQKVVKE